MRCLLREKENMSSCTIVDLGCSQYTCEEPSRDTRCPKRNHGFYLGSGRGNGRYEGEMFFSSSRSA